MIKSRRGPLLLVAFVLALAIPPTFATVNPQCPPLLNFDPKAKFQSLDELFSAFRNGLVPNLKDPEQRQAFELYRTLRFGDPGTRLNSGTMEEIANALARFPELEKKPFRDFLIGAARPPVPVTEELKNFIQSQLKGNGQVRSNLFQIDANLGYWKKILQYEDPAKYRVVTEDKEARKKLQAEANERFHRWFEKKFPKELREAIADERLEPHDRVQRVYWQLQIERRKLMKAGKDVGPISQAMVDTVYSTGFLSPARVELLKKGDGAARLAAFQQILAECDTVAMQLERGGHFSDVLKKYGVARVSGVEDFSGLTKQLSEMEKKMLATKTAETAVTEHKTVRHLSLVESPYRSCLGGSDCSSRTYLLRALDPNYHYFTLTDHAGNSSGHFTVVLGEAILGGERTKVAFIDKIQNVPNSDIPGMMEGIRLSMKEQGYTLVLPTSVGDHNGISNESTTRLFVDEFQKKLSGSERYSNFVANPHPYHFPNKYSRLDERLEFYRVPAMEPNPKIEITAGGVSRAWSRDEISITEIAEESYKLKDGDTEDRIRYLTAMQALREAKLHADPEFDAVVKRWIDEAATPFKLRRELILSRMGSGHANLWERVYEMNPQEQLSIVKRILDSPAYRKRLIERDDPIGLLIAIRKNSEAKRLLVETVFDSAAIDKGRLALADMVLDIPGDYGASPGEWLALDALREEANGGSVEIALEIGHLLEGYPARHEWLANVLMGDFGWRGNDAIFGTFSRKLTKMLYVERHAGKDLAESPLGKMVREVVARFRPTNDVEFGKAVIQWAGQTETDRESLVAALKWAWGGPDWLEEGIRKAIPPESLGNIDRELFADTSVGVFRTLAKRNILNGEKLLGKNPLEAFEFKTMISEEDDAREATRFRNQRGETVLMRGAYEIALTPMTELQQLLITGKVSRSAGEKTEQAVSREGITSHYAASKAATSMNAIEAQEMIDVLNANDPDWYYAVANSDQWAYAAYGKRESLAHLNESREISENAVLQKKNGKTVAADVMDLFPNANGLYDMRGLVPQFTSPGPMSRYSRRLETRGGRFNNPWFRIGVRADDTGYGIRLIRMSKNYAKKQGLVR